MAENETIALEFSCSENVHECLKEFEFGFPMDMLITQHRPKGPSLPSQECLQSSFPLFKKLHTWLNEHAVLCLW